MSKNRNLANLIASSSNPITDLIASAPAALNTLDELAAALNDDANFATTITNSLATKASIANPVFTGTASATLPSGTTAQRPTGQVGMIRYNTTLEALEMFEGAQWVIVKSVFTATGGTITTASGYVYHTFTSSGTFQVTKGSTLVEYLIVAGGGSSQQKTGDDAGGGGGGAGGYISGSLTVNPSSYSIIVGAGGTPGSNGSNSVFNGNTAIGGGRGAAYSGVSSASGGSGGGGAYSAGPSSGTAGQGNAGGTAGQGTPGYGGGGGGGAGGVGGNSPGTDTPGDGGAGSQWLNGSYYAGGGGGATRSSQYTSTAPGNGGIGGGGQGSGAVNGYTGINGVANTGGGAGGTSASTNAGRNGGSGIVIIRYTV